MFWAARAASTVMNKEGITMPMIPFRVTPHERDQLKHDAHQHDMNVSEYIRWLIQKERDAK